MDKLFSVESLEKMVARRDTGGIMTGSGLPVVTALATELLDTMRENERLHVALEDIVKNAKQSNSEINCACNGLCEDIASEALRYKDTEHG